MACACNSGKKSGPVTYTVVLPGGKTKVYSSEVAAAAEVSRVTGSYMQAPATASI
jgi:hypothetical protein